MNKTISVARLFLAPVLALLLAAAAHATAPGIQGNAFSLTASEAYVNQQTGRGLLLGLRLHRRHDGIGCLCPALSTPAFCHHHASSRPHAGRHGRPSPSRSP